jgi:predicted nucleotide-binding protein (sugar kinase/HSP70/actin superfamily)
MCVGASRAFAACFRGVGVEARPCPQAGDEATELARRYTSGDECYPQVVTLADFFQAMAEEGFDPNRAAFLMPTTDGPCRFGQYAHLLARVLRLHGCPEIAVVSPSSETGYRDVAAHATSLKRLLWWATVGTDVLRSLLHRTRPYEVVPGTADDAHEAGLEDLCRVLEGPGGAGGAKLGRVAASLSRSLERFRGVETDRSRDRLLVGMVGEIFCRLSTYSNEDLIRTVERLGGEVWLSGIGEWVWYVNEWEKLGAKASGWPGLLSWLGTNLSLVVQRRDEHRLLDPVAGAFRGYEEPHEVKEVLELARPYLPWEGALGEMVLSVGKAAYLQGKGADAVIDVSPFGCMNGVVSEAVYPRLSRDYGGIPIRNFYFDGSRADPEPDLEIFLELARNYSRKKPAPRPPAGLGA